MINAVQSVQEQIEDCFSKETLIERLFCDIMQLPEESRNRIHKKYLERYGWYVD